MKTSKCISVSPSGKRQIDDEKYWRYSNTIISEGNRLLALNAMDLESKIPIIRCREILYSPYFLHKKGNNLAEAKNVLRQQTVCIGPMLALELMGISLAQYGALYYQNHLPVPLITLRCIAIQLFNAFSFLHDKGGFIHGDLKPDNVLVSLEDSDRIFDNEYPSIKIADFGNSMRFDHKVRTYEVQSLFYRAPEVLFGIEMTAAIDMWSVGCILLEFVMQSGNAYGAIFACDDASELAYKIYNLLGAFPEFFYNPFISCYFVEITEFCRHWSRVYHAKSADHFTQSQPFYNATKEDRKNALLNAFTTPIPLKLPVKLPSPPPIPKSLPLSISTAPPYSSLPEFEDFIDLIACLLDPNPATRYSAHIAPNHPFCSPPQFDDEIAALIEKMHEITLGPDDVVTDFQRQCVVNRQIIKYQKYQSEQTVLIQVPEEITVTKKYHSMKEEEEDDEKKQE